MLLTTVEAQLARIVRFRVLKYGYPDSLNQRKVWV